MDEDGKKLCETIPSPWLLAFEDLRPQMRPLSAPNQTIYKRIVRDGRSADTDSAPASAASTSNFRLTVHYNGYFEQTEQPFDSTYLRGTPFVFVTGQQATLAGIELACLSMHAGEEAQFVIPHALLYGELGCPPRIPPRADGLYVMQLLRCIDVGDDQGLERLPDADRHRFAVVMPMTRNVHIKGMDAFKRQDYVLAKRMFHKAVIGLEACTLANEAEADEQQRFIVRLYTNLALCYNKLDAPRRACLMCTEAERLLGGHSHKNCKVLFQHGRALLQLGEFRRAEHKLTQAQQLQPTNTDITAELKLLATKKGQHIRDERQLWQRAFGMTAEASNATEAAKGATAKDSVSNLDAAFRSMTLKCLQEFKSNAQSSTMQLPAGLTGDEVECVRHLITDQGIQLEVRGLNEKTYTLRKSSARSIE